MSTNELNTLARDLKELRLMAEQLDAEIKTILYVRTLAVSFYSKTNLMNNDLSSTRIAGSFASLNCLKTLTKRSPAMQDSFFYLSQPRFT